MSVVADFERLAALIAGAGTLGYGVRALTVEARDGHAAIVRAEFVELDEPAAPAASANDAPAAAVVLCSHPVESRVSMGTMGRARAFHCRACGETVEG